MHDSGEDARVELLTQLRHIIDKIEPERLTAGDQAALLDLLRKSMLLSADSTL